MNFLRRFFILMTLVAPSVAQGRSGKQLRGKRHKTDIALDNQRYLNRDLKSKDYAEGRISQWPSKSKKCKSKLITNKSKKSIMGQLYHTSTFIHPDCVAIPDMFYTREGTPVTITDLLENDNKLDGDTLTMESYTTPVHGDLVDNGDGTFMYTPHEGFIGVDTYEYTVVDGLGQPFVGMVSITVVEVNGIPSANDDFVDVMENTPVVVEAIDILGNDSDPDGDILILQSCTRPKNGQVKRNKGLKGSFIYTPNTGFVGIDKMICTVIDKNGGVDTSTIQFIVHPIDNEFAIIDIFVTSMNSAITVNAPGILENDEGFINGLLTVENCAEPDRGTLTFEENGAFLFTPDEFFIGIESIECSILNGQGGRDTSEIIIVVQPPFVNNGLVTDEDVPLPLDPEEILTSVSITDTFDVENCGAPYFGTMVQNSDGTFLYTPEANFHGNDLTECTITKPTGESSEIVIVIVVRPVNDEPTAVNDNYSVNENTPITFNPLENDLNVEISQTLEIHYFTQPSNGGVVQNDDGTLTYTPPNGFIGKVTFDYTLSDGEGGQSSAVITVNVLERINNAPMALDDFYSTGENTPLIIDNNLGVLINDQDIDNHDIFVTSLTQPLYGTIAMNSLGGFTYLPAVDWSGLDIFDYSMSDEEGGTDSATVMVTVVAAANIDGAAKNDMYIILQDTQLNVESPGVFANDDVVNVTIVYTEPSNGKLTARPDGSFTYVPKPNFYGLDSFDYTVTDDEGLTDSAQVSIVIQITNVPPLIIPGGDGDTFILDGADTTVFAVSSDCKGVNFSNCTNVTTVNEKHAN